MTRYFKVVEANKTAQGGKKTKFDQHKLYSGTPHLAAMKAFTHTCKHFTKKVKGVCTLSITVMEVTKTKINNLEMIKEKTDSNGKIIKFKYDLKLQKVDKVVQIDDKPITFSYATKIVKSYGRV